MKIIQKPSGIYYFEPDKWENENKEDTDQKAYAAWMKYRFPMVTWFHVPNETKGSVQHYISREMKGVRDGVSDNIILSPGKWPKGAIEHKKNASKRPQFRPGQLPFLEEVVISGGFAAVTYGIHQLKMATLYYFGLESRVDLL